MQSPCHHPALPYSKAKSASPFSEIGDREGLQPKSKNNES